MLYRSYVEFSVVYDIGIVSYKTLAASSVEWNIVECNVVIGY